MKIKIKYSYKLLLLFLGAAFIAFGFLGDDNNGVRTPKPIYKITGTQESGKQGDAYGMNVNNIWMPMNRRGIIADVNIPPNGSLGQYAGGGFLFSSGFFLSGYKGGVLWANAAASASLVEDYVQGVVDGENDPNAVIYVINSQDEPFGQSWQDWADAVALGADFVDGDGDGIYNPVDKNGNGLYDPDEDMPDLIGDELAWCVYHDGLPVAQRRWNTSIEAGIEVRQSVFAFASAGAIGNIVFVRYRIKYVGLTPTDPDQLTEVYFGAWADPDLGDATDDVIGVDVPRNSGYTYGNGPDAQYGAQVPCFMIDFFSGPRAYIAGVTYIDNNGNNVYDDGIDTPLDTAHSVQGQIKGIVEYPGATNLPISSFVVYFNGVAALGDPNDKDEARSYALGFDRFGEEVDPCNFAFGEVRGGVDCATVDSRFWYSGDPVTDVGWICNQNRDVRQMTNTGPFLLNKNEENEIVIAYVVGRGSDPLDGITKARAIDDGAQNIFDLNFLAPTPPPAPQVTLSSSDDFIDISWETRNQVGYKSVTPTWDLGFEGYQIWAFKTNIPEDIVSGQPNSVLLAKYDLDNFIDNIYKENSETGGIELLYEVSSPEFQMDSALYVDPATGRIRLRIFNDPFSPNTPVVKGRPYYFAVTSYALNYLALVYKAGPENPVGTPGDYYLSSFAFAQEAENIRSIRSIVVGESAINPPVAVQPANKISGASLGNVGYDVINNQDLTGHNYEVTFFKDSSSIPYSMFWKLTNLSTGTVLEDTGRLYNYGLPVVNQEITDGFITKVERQNATIGLPTYTGEVWYNFTRSPIDSLRGRGIWYMGKDLVTEEPSYLFLPENETTPYPFRLNSNRDTVKSTYLTTNKLRKVELRFGEEGFGKAYRYINGYKAAGPGQVANNLFPYASKITSTDTVGKGPIGKWDEVNNRAMGYVDVPFQAWVVDEQNNENYQVAVGFIESKAKSAFFSKGNPDGIWDPGTFIPETGEYLIIFDSPYDPDGNQIELTGGEFQTGSGPVTIWADFVRWYPALPFIPADAQGITDEQRSVFNSPCLSTMYLLGLARIDSTSWFTPGDVMTIPLDVYPYTEEDVYQFSTLAGTTVTEEDERARWEKVNVYPNPLFGYNTLSNYYSNTPDEPFVTFTNLPEDVTIKIYSLSGTLLRTLTTDDKDSPTSPFLRWDLQNESELRVASGMYLAIVTNPKYGDKVLKFAIIMPQKQIQRF
ncbi:MAG: T9SS type A sorting domain-containing protein [Ignavibacteriaceae bacterium]|nr:T9SS type A sorting domain-containing protein [Ignavibacteriaceae bacterium]